MESPSALGKRKEREDESSIAHGSTLFVSNLPYSATSTDLQTLFSDIAPVRSAFVVLDQESKVSKGVGYVSFAVREDAQLAHDQIASDGLKLLNRALRVQWADNKKKDGEEIKKPSKAPKLPHPSHTRAPHDPQAVRTLVVSGLPTGVDKPVLWKKFRKFNGAEEVKWPITGEDGAEDSLTAHVLFKTPNLATDAVSRLHAHVYKGSLLSVTLKKRIEALSRSSAPTAKSTTSPSKTQKSSLAPSHNSRLIVRNLPFDITEQDLRAAFLPYGPIHSIHIPTTPAPSSMDVDGDEADVKEVKPTQPRTKGFAFIWMLSRKDAEKAMEGCNGKTIRAGAAQQLVLDKQKKKKLIRLQKKMQSSENAAAVAAEDVKEEEGEGVVPEPVKAEEGEDEEEAKAATMKERTMAVDWALSKDRWNEEKAKMDVDAPEDSDADDDSVKEEEDSEDEDTEGSDSDDSSALGVHDRDSDSEGEEPVKPQLPPPETGTTLFIRNVPFQATEDELRTLFRAFGPLRYARITMDPETGRSRGTGFACFWNIEDADKVVQQSELLRAETTAGTESTVKKSAVNPFKLPSILTPDPSSSLAQSLVLHGRTLDAVRAVTRDQAGRLKEEGERRREKADKRNMYLLREGVILPNSPAAHLLTPAEVEKRTSSFNARRQLLKTNPALYISKTRLSVRQIPVYVTERMLKKLANYAVKAFREEVKAGKRKELTQDELLETTDDQDQNENEQGSRPDSHKAHAKGNDKDNDDHEDENDDSDDNGDGKKSAKGGKSRKFGSSSKKLTGVKQAKIVRIQERVDPVTMKGRSKGYGFVEMHKHADSLRVLRWANNNPDVWPVLEGCRKEELELLVKSETAKLKSTKEKSKSKAKGEDEADEEQTETRIRRIKDELENGGKRKPGKGSLIIEFSIENRQVVQRRSNRGEEPRKRPAAKEGEQDEKERRPTKKAKTSKSDTGASRKESVKVKEESVKPSSNPVGTIIGRKRKQKQMKKGK